MSNPFNEVLIFKALADEHWKQIQQLERENAALRAKNEVLLIALYDCIKYANCGETGNIEPRARRAIGAEWKE